jgi:hypothetical protein
LRLTMVIQREQQRTKAGAQNQTHDDGDDGEQSFIALLFASLGRGFLRHIVHYIK